LHKYIVYTISLIVAIGFIADLSINFETWSWTNTIISLVSFSISDEQDDQYKQFTYDSGYLIGPHTIFSSRFKAFLANCPRCWCRERNHPWVSEDATQIYHTFSDLPAYWRSLCWGKNDLRRYWGHSRYCRILASCTLPPPRFPTPLNSPSVDLIIVKINNFVLEFILNTTQICKHMKFMYTL